MPKKTQSPLELTRRPRRLRASKSIRELVRETQLDATDLIQPLFVIDGNGGPESIESMPEQFRLPVGLLGGEVELLWKNGIRAIALFPSLDPSLKDERGSEALNPDTLILRAVRVVKRAVPEMLVITDIALDPYTLHGHDGVLTEDGHDVANDETVRLLSEMALLHAHAGVDLVAPSDMMDGRVGAIRSDLDLAGYTQTGILAYSAKFASAFYGPFRDAVGSAQAKPISKATYQLEAGNRRAALLEARLDEEEGADILMVKPAGAYLDIIRDIREETTLPLAAYQVSGEYAQIHAAARFGWIDYQQARDESLLAIRRAGADLILTYFASEVARELSSGS